MLPVVQPAKNYEYMPRVTQGLQSPSRPSIIQTFTTPINSKQKSIVLQPSNLVSSYDPVYNLEPQDIDVSF